VRERETERDREREREREREGRHTDWRILGCSALSALSTPREVNKMPYRMVSRAFMGTRRAPCFSNLNHISIGLQNTSQYDRKNAGKHKLCVCVCVCVCVFVCVCVCVCVYLWC
jgi:hypothetical protein